MTATFAPSPWPSPAVARRDGGWRFASEQQAPAGWLFDLRRNVSLSPRQMLLAYALVCALSLAVAGGFWWHGVRVVGIFTGLELVAVGIALLYVARHAGDRETILLSGRELAVARHCGADVERLSFRAEWVRVEPAAGVGSLVELSGEGRSVRVGRHVRPELRAELADELRRALRLSRALNERE
jgi:uncharacterized membrane protein